MFITGDNSDIGGFDKYINAYVSDNDNDIDLSSVFIFNKFSSIF